MELEDKARDLSLDRLEERKWKYAHVDFGGGLFNAGEVRLSFTSR